MGVVSLKGNKPVHADETADGTLPAAAAPVASGLAAYGGLAHMFIPPPPTLTLSRRQAGRDYLPEALAPGRLTIPWAVQAQTEPTDLTRPIADGLISLEWDVSARSAASISGAARVGETPTTRIPGFVDAHRLNHAAFTCLYVPDDGAADAGIPDATGTTRSRSDEDGGSSSNARGPPPRPPGPPRDLCR